MNCPYHDSAACGDARPVAGMPQGALLACGYPASVCLQCSATNRGYARFCRMCAAFLAGTLDGDMASSLTGAMWKAVLNGAEPVSYPIALPRPAREISALVSRWGFLFVGAPGAGILVLNALKPAAPLATIPVPGTVRALGVYDGYGAPGAPALVVTTGDGVYRLPLIPAPGAEAVWKGGGDVRTAPAGAAFPLASGTLVFRERSPGVEALWMPWDGEEGAAVIASDPFAGPVGHPIAIGSEAGFFTGDRTVHVLRKAEGAPLDFRSCGMAMSAEPSAAPSHLAETGEVFFVYRENGLAGIARTSLDGANATRCTAARYAVAQVLCVDRSTVAVVSDRDLEFVRPVTGEPKWSLSKNLHLDGLNLAIHPPLRCGDHFFAIGRRGGGSEALYQVPLTDRDLPQGPMKIAEVGRASLPPLAVPGGIVCATRSGTGSDPVLRIVHPPHPGKA